MIRIGRAEEAGGKKKKLKLLFKLMIKLIIKLTRLCSEAVTYSSTGFMILTYNREKQQYIYQVNDMSNDREGRVG